MMLLGPLLIALIPVVIILACYRWVRTKEIPFLIKMLPGIVSFVMAILIFSSGVINVRGFEGLTYGILSFYLIGAGIIVLFGVKHMNVKSYIS